MSTQTSGENSKTCLVEVVQELVESDFPVAVLVKRFEHFVQLPHHNTKCRHPQPNHTNVRQHLHLHLHVHLHVHLAFPFAIA